MENNITSNNEDLKDVEIIPLQIIQYNYINQGKSDNELNQTTRIKKITMSKEEWCGEKVWEEIMTPPSEKTEENSEKLMRYFIDRRK